MFNIAIIKPVTIIGIGFSIFAITKNIQVFLIILTFNFIEMKTCLHLLTQFRYTGLILINYVQYLWMYITNP